MFSSRPLSNHRALLLNLPARALRGQSLGLLLSLPFQTMVLSHAVASTAIASTQCAATMTATVRSLVSLTGAKIHEISGYSTAHPQNPYPRTRTLVITFDPRGTSPRGANDSLAYAAMNQPSLLNEMASAILRACPGYSVVDYQVFRTTGWHNTFYRFAEGTKQIVCVDVHDGTSAAWGHSLCP